jgi:hypothetical protein
MGWYSSSSKQDREAGGLKVLVVRERLGQVHG